MRWKGGRQSSNVEDRGSQRGSSQPSLLAGGGIGGVVVILVIMFLSGGNLDSVLDVFSQSAGIQPSRYETQNVSDTHHQEQKEFAAVVFGYLEDYWETEFAESGQTYQQPTLVLFSGSVRSACGQASAQVGPFYCPADEKVYLDLSFGDELAKRYGATGDFAMAYVLAHEVGHHIQNQLGISDAMHRLRQQLSEKEYNRYSVQLELQADYLAGSFAKYLAGETYEGQAILEVGDIEEAIVAANAIGDDTLQKQAQGYVVPDSFTHGTSADRVEWFQQGVKYGDLEHGDTFRQAGLELSY